MKYTRKVPAHHKLYSDMIAVEEWKESCRLGLFTDYDGYGYAVKDGMMTEEKILPSKADDVPHDAVWIVWLNK